MSARGLAVASMLLLACGDAPEPGTALAPGEFRLEPSRGAERLVRQDPSRGVIERRGLTLVEQIARAWDVAPRDLEFDAALPALQEGGFDIRVRSADGQLATAEALLRGGLAAHLGLRVRSERRHGDVFVLRRVRGGLVPEPVEAESIEAEPQRARGRYRGAGAPISDLARYLRSYGRRPIVDETRLSGRYDIVLEWDPQAGGRALHVALRDAGFELVPSERDFVVHVVEPSS